MQRLFIHCGLHKTGTTAIQIAFAARRATKPSEGDIFYPKAGCPLGASGHHNIAWQSTGDWRFEPNGGTLDTLKAEIGSAGGDVLISSEDFESILCRDDLIRIISEFAKAVGRQPVFIVYLRNQLAYADSLYRTLVRHGFNEEFGQFAERAAAHGHVALCDWVFHFDYARALSRLSRCENAVTVVRSYDALGTTSAVVDLAQVVGLETIAIQNRAVDNRAAAKPALADSLRHFCANRWRRPTTILEDAVIEMLVGSARGLPIAAGAGIADKFAVAFSGANHALCENFGIAPHGLRSGAPGFDAAPLLMERVFSERTVTMIAALASSNPSNHFGHLDFDGGPAAWWREPSVCTPMAA
ncbi:hypothetical protein [Beijerinckia sp. L45]|uniref:hypothetical protein n=1 Tax=Beijerinckia sp. L45 TaxID=1641855 RepID=UPI00131DB24A|nr:hypothetical protein [Beijerinckia sp. L45]